MSFWNRSDAPWTPAGDPTSQRAPEPEAQAKPPDAGAPAPAEPLPAPAAAATPAAPAPPRTDGGLRIGRGIRLEGKLTFSGTVRIDATFQGSIVTDGVLVVGEHAQVDAEITCGSLVVEGTLRGDVKAKETVELRSSALMQGDVESPALTIDRGARFEGASRRPGGKAATGGKAAAAPISGK